jgi:hypothetical protein
MMEALPPEAKIRRVIAPFVTGDRLVPMILLCGLMSSDAVAYVPQPITSFSLPSFGRLVARTRVRPIVSFLGEQHVINALPTTTVASSVDLPPDFQELVHRAPAFSSPDLIRVCPAT